MEAATRFLISGHVQGVCFRINARDQANRLGIRGHARNLPDGRVEVLAIGPEHAMQQFADWLAQGPPQARVDAVLREEEASAAVVTTAFAIR